MTKINPTNIEIIASYSFKIVLILTISIAVWKKEWIR